MRELLLLDVPLTATELEQYKAHAERANSHVGLPGEERNVQIRVICTRLPPRCWCHAHAVSVGVSLDINLI